MCEIDMHVALTKSPYSLRFVNGEWVIFKNAPFKTFKQGQEALQELRRLQLVENVR